MLLTTCGRDISFLTAEKSMNRPVVGFFAKASHAIPVKRRQDVARSVSRELSIVFAAFVLVTSVQS